MSDRGFIDWTPRGESLQLVEHILTVVNFYKVNGYPAPTRRDVYF